MADIIPHQRADRTQHSRPCVRDIAPTDEYANHDKCAENIHHIVLTRNAEWTFS